MKATNKIVVQGTRSAKIYAGRPERFLEFSYMDEGSTGDVDLRKYEVMRVSLLMSGDVVLYVKERE